MPSYFRVTLLRSAIGLPRRTGAVLQALGLKKRMATVFHPVTPDAAGMIMRVKELVSVEEVDRPLTQKEVHLERKPHPGYFVERRAADIMRETRELE
ncbi:39S ribosomal protein L33, mitochondrial [Ascosphaera acerosa]|nr:39S ribosomal protein L33, mitochondrial [Ascosphaera acerosa]